MYSQISKVVLQLIFTGESVAFLEACLYAESYHISKVVIFADSLSCLKELLQDPFNNKLHSALMLQIKESIFKSYRIGRMVQLVWIASHSGIMDNECADSMARNAISSVVADQKHLIHHHNDLLRLPQGELVVIVAV